MTTSRYSISKGAILQYICKGELPPPSRSVFQVMGTRKIANPPGAGSNGNMLKYRVSISDGNHRFSQAVLMLDDESQVPQDLSLISIDQDQRNMVKHVNGKLILVIGGFQVCNIFC